MNTGNDRGALVYQKSGDGHGFYAWDSKVVKGIMFGELTVAKQWYHEP